MRMWDLVCNIGLREEDESAQCRQLASSWSDEEMLCGYFLVWIRWRLFSSWSMLPRVTSLIRNLFPFRFASWLALAVTDKFVLCNICCIDASHLKLIATQLFRHVIIIICFSIVPYEFVPRSS